MRYQVRADQPTKLVDTRKFKRAPNVLVRVITPGTIYVATDRYQLDTTDQTNTPQQGAPLSNTDPPLLLESHAAELWGRGTIDPGTEVDVQVLLRGAA